mmetsp:Transcript_29674/g.67261  ORF Transcript_29674/g.67261 Transcript_29674/m.67261 type:complete len:83 (-) Transcript_29674:378-626(-)
MRGEQDDFREDYDAARGGKGAGLLKRLAEDPNRQVYVGKRKIDDSAVPNKRHRGEQPRVKQQDDGRQLPASFGRGKGGKGHR